MRAVMNLAGVGLRQIARDRRALILILVLPMVIAVVVGFATGQAEQLRVGVTDSDGLLGRDLVRQLEARPNIELRSYGSADDLRLAVLRGTVLAGAVVPADYDASARSAEPVSIPVVVGSGTASQAARAELDAAIARQAAQLEAALAAPSTTSFEEAYRAAGELAARSDNVAVHVETTDGKSITSAGLAYSAPAMLVLFTFMAALGAAAGLSEARRLGITRRVLASPTRPGAIIAGIGLGCLLVAVSQSLVLITGAAVLGTDWGDPAGAAALIVVFAAVSTAAGLLVATFVRNSQLANAIAGPVGVALGMLGGCMWSLEVAGPTLARIGHLTPQAWALDGWLALADGASLRNLLPELAALLAFCVVLVPFATWRLRRSITNT